MFFNIIHFRSFQRSWKFSVKSSRREIINLETYGTHTFQSLCHILYNTIHLCHIIYNIQLKHCTRFHLKKQN